MKKVARFAAIDRAVGCDANIANSRNRFFLTSLLWSKTTLSSQFATIQPIPVFPTYRQIHRKQPHLHSIQQWHRACNSKCKNLTALTV